MITTQQDYRTAKRVFGQLTGKLKPTKKFKKLKCAERMIAQFHSISDENKYELPEAIFKFVQLYKISYLTHGYPKSILKESMSHFHRIFSSK